MPDGAVKVMLGFGAATSSATPWPPGCAAARDVSPKWPGHGASYGPPPEPARCSAAPVPAGDHGAPTGRARLLAASAFAAGEVLQEFVSLVLAGEENLDAEGQG
ncbi:hypothetical protein GCM10010319_61560 [Streptomyces blastmyceticus]|uniref:Uncharacterized protein n=1 Tax=Streptomyces blastmyceticus TaxID=68180 RepID=A0ABP3HMQ2_9ACTN